MFANTIIALVIFSVKQRFPLTSKILAILRPVKDPTEDRQPLRGICATFILCVFLNGCTVESQTSTVVTESSTATAVSDAPANVEISTPSQGSQKPAETGFAEQPDLQPPLAADESNSSADYTPWEWLSDEQSTGIIQRDLRLLKAANALLASHRIAESKTLTELIDASELDTDQQIELNFLKVRHFLHNGRFKYALAALNAMTVRHQLDSKQQLRFARLKAYTLSHFDQPLALIAALIDLYLNLPSGSEQTAVGHRLWSLLTAVPDAQLLEHLALVTNPVEKQWIELAVAVSAVAHDPFLHDQALASWQNDHPDHPARNLIENGLSTDSLWINKIAVLLPLSSNNQLAAQTFANGLTTQHNANSSPDKPELMIIDVGDNPRGITRHYYDAVAAGADFVIGPLGTEHVLELATYGDLILPTLLLGDAADIPLPLSVMQFTLAPEHEGMAIAQRARNVGHTTALILQQPSNWSTRAVDAFKDEWHRLGGAVVDSVTFPVEETDYSQTIKEALNIDSSAERYRHIKQLVGRSMEFDPRRRQDIEFVVLSADSNHGRLVKPHIDFLGAHNLPVFATSHIFTGEFNKIRDLDLDSIEFADMDWLIDQGANMLHLKEQFEPAEPVAKKYERIFAMGIDAYNLALRSRTFLTSADARYHGVTALLEVDEDGNVIRSVKWARFKDGIPTLVQTFSDPEFTPAQLRFSKPDTPALQR